MKLTYLIDAWLVIVLAVCFGAVLAAVQITLGPKIDENKRDATYDKIPAIVPGAVKDKIVEVTTEAGRVYQCFDATGQHVGWVVRAVGDGYADKIELLIGLSPDAAQITGMDVLSQKETPALGNKISQPFFRRQFAKLTTSEALAVKQDGGQIIAITAATISSRSVCKIVNDAVAVWRPVLLKLDPAAPTEAKTSPNSDG